MGRREELLRQFEAKVVNQYNGSFAGMSIDGPVFRYGAREYPINTISAEVTSGSKTSKSRSTATRIIGGGLVAGPGGMLLGGAAKKKSDTSKVHMTVKLGDGSVHTISKPADQEAQLRRFADKLESAVNRKWPITTALGTTIDLDRSSVRPKQASYLASALLSVLVLTVFLLLVIKWWAIAVGIAMIATLLVIDDRKTKALQRELDEHFPGWREKGQQLERTKDDEIWEEARKQARGTNDY